MMPEVQVMMTQTEQMMALSIKEGYADSDKEVLSRESDDWNIWGTEEE